MGSQARRALLLFRGAGFPQSGTQWKRGPTAVSLRGSRDPPSPSRLPLLSWARARAVGSLLVPVCVLAEGSQGLALALSAEMSYKPRAESVRPNGRGPLPHLLEPAPGSAWPWPGTGRAGMPGLPPPRFWQLLPVPTLGWGRAMISGGTSGHHCRLFLLGSDLICGFLCRIPVEPGARQSAAKVLLDFGERKTEGETGRQAAWRSGCQGRPGAGGISDLDGNTAARSRRGSGCTGPSACRVWVLREGLSAAEPGAQGCFAQVGSVPSAPQQRPPEQAGRGGPTSPEGLGSQ